MTNNFDYEKTINSSELPVEDMRKGRLSDKYFVNNRKILQKLANEGYTFNGVLPEKFKEIGIDISTYKVGDAIAEMQIFTRREPFTVVAGINEVLEVLKEATGYYNEDGEFVNTFHELEIDAVPEGTIVEYNGNPANVKPVMKIRGRYLDYAVLESIYLGILAEESRVATNVFLDLEAAYGKRISLFCSRFAHWKVQKEHGYAYSVAVDTFEKKYGINAGKYASTDVQAETFGKVGGGTMNHALIQLFLGDTAEAYLQYCRMSDVNDPHTPLIDFNNDCVREVEKIVKKVFPEYLKLMKEGKTEEARKFRIDEVRPDTGGNMVDKSIYRPTEQDFGVCPNLVFNIKEKVMNMHKETEWINSLKYSDLEIFKQYTQKIEVFATGGFKSKKIKLFKKFNVPVNGYGVGSSILENSSENNTNNDFTADLVRIKINDTWHDNAKEGRCACANPELIKVQ